jgi:hypothetical protein
VETVVRAGGEVDQADVRSLKPVTFAQHDAAQVVLATIARLRPNFSRSPAAAACSNVASCRTS